MEPVCADVFPGNSVDSTSYESFVRENNITKGTILADKGFPPNQIREWLKNHPDLHYITPVKRDDQRIRKYSLNIYDTMLRGTECPVMGIKAKLTKGCSCIPSRTLKIREGGFMLPEQSIKKGNTGRKEIR